MSAPRVTKIQLKKNKDSLHLVYDNEKSADLSAEYLRTHAPSADVQGHSAGQRKTVSGKKGILISAVAPVGHYAIRITFSDGHNTGIYTWAYLWELSTNQDAYWQEYLQELEQKGLSRD